MTPHDYRQSVALSLILALADMVKRGEKPGTFRHRKALDLEVRATNTVNSWRNMAFDEESLRHAGAICDMVEAELNKRFPNVQKSIDNAD